MVHIDCEWSQIPILTRTHTGVFFFRWFSFKLPFNHTSLPSLKSRRLICLAFGRWTRREATATAWYLFRFSEATSLDKAPTRVLVSSGYHPTFQLPAVRALNGDMAL